MSKPVFTIISEYDAIISEIEELGGEITPELAVKLAINEQELAQKIRAYYFVIKTKEAEINLAKDEQERLNNVRKTKENVIKRLKNVVDLAVETFGTTKPSGTKGIDLGDLKVWQKKTEALELFGDIDDERFCEKKFAFNTTYDRYAFILDALNHLDISPIITIDLAKDKLKQWLIDNKEEHKTLRQKASEITNVEFEEINGIPLPVEETQEDKDLKVILASNIKHNSTVIFK
jgi:hypothetical protein